MKKYTLFLLPFIIGCGYVEFKLTDKPAQIVAKSVEKNEAKDVANAMSGISKEEATILYKQYSGVAEFLDNTERLTSTSEIDSVVDGFKSTYSLKVTDKKWLDFIEAWFKARNYEEPKKIVNTVSDEKKEISRAQIIADFRILAEGAKLTVEQKDVNSK